MRAKGTESMRLPWVVVAPSGVHWLGHAEDEAAAWTIALGWPDADEIRERKRAGWYAAEAAVTWKRPAGVPPSPVPAPADSGRRFYEVLHTFDATAYPDPWEQLTESWKAAYANMERAYGVPGTSLEQKGGT